MIDLYLSNKTLTLESISLEDGPENEHMSYVIRITTDCGQILIRGSHDDGPCIDNTNLLTVYS